MFLLICILIFLIFNLKCFIWMNLVKYVYISIVFNYLYCNWIGIVSFYVVFLYNFGIIEDVYIVKMVRCYILVLVRKMLWEDY